MNRRGYTLLELLVAIPLLMIFTLVTMSILALLIKSAGYSSRAHRREIRRSRAHPAPAAGSQPG
jgi:prepilin-type N-terminal cleavage/methylation domain-containing protein